MAYFKRTTIFKSIFFSRGMALFVIFLIVFMGFAIVSIAGKSIEAAKSRKIADAQATQLKDKEGDLSTKLTLLKTPDGQEAALREQYPVVRPGEHVVVITNENQPSAAPATEGAAPAPQKGFWNFFKNLFKK